MQINAQQQRVIEELDRNILLIASAGTGKTNTMAHRVGHILTAQRAKGEEILCLTFTNKACVEMKERIMRLAGAEAKAVEVSTFHSFCYKLLREESKREADLFQDMVIYDEEDCRELLEPYRPAELKMMDFQNFISFVKEYRSLYELYGEDEKADYEATLLRLTQEKKEAWDSLFQNLAGVWEASVKTRLKEQGAAILSAYQQALREVHGVDFTDLITMVHRLFKDPLCRERWRSRYRYICVDEMQDTSDLEYLVLKQLWPDNIVLLCGDYFQTIYEWRGSNPLEIVADYKENFAPELIVFYENYRANRTLFTAAYSVLKEMFPREIAMFYEETPYAAATAVGEPITLVKAANDWQEAEYIFRRIANLPKEEALCCGVLVRNNFKARFLSEEFAKLNGKLRPEERREFMLIDEFKFFRRQEIKDVLAYFKLLLNPHDALSAKRIIKRFVKGVGEARLQALEKAEVRRAGLKVTDFLNIDIFSEEPYERLLAGIEADNIVVFDVESTGTDTTRDEIIQIAALRLTKDGQELEVFEEFIRPTIPVGDSEAVHHFSDAFLAEKGKPAAEVLQAFKAFSKNAVIVGHNVQYDVSIFTSELHRHNLGKPEFGAVYDTLDMFCRFYPNLPNHKLGFLSTHFAISHTPTHNALDDIRATGLLLYYIVGQDIRPTQNQRRAHIAAYRPYFAPLASMMATLRNKSRHAPLTEVLAYIMNDLGVRTYYEERHEMNRVEYIREFYRMLVDLEKETGNLPVGDRLQRILQLASLTAGEPNQRWQNEARIPIITVHQAKGSEFAHVFVAGLTEGAFPSQLAVREGRLAEEMRLFYVAITRAKETLTLTYAAQSGRQRTNRPSSFLKYLPPALLQEVSCGYPRKD